jgi:hypothetical protein
MGRFLIMAVAVGIGMALGATPAAAQVDIGVWTPNGGGRVVLGSPRIYYPPPVHVYREPRVYIVERPYYPRFRPGWARGYARGHGRVGRDADYGYPRYASRVYRVDRYDRPYSRDARYERRPGRGRR